MKNIILKSENITISFDDKVEENYTISTKGSIVLCLKHLYRYNEFHMPKEIMATILLKALKGCNCEQDHFDISQRLTIYKYLKDKDIDDPHIQQFMKETESKQNVKV